MLAAYTFELNKERTRLIHRHNTSDARGACHVCVCVFGAFKSIQINYKLHIRCHMFGGFLFVARVSHVCQIEMWPARDHFYIALFSTLISI